ncbi:MAG TPA: hypothetical protein VGI45_13995 [Terracidiphilus sp.]|jgi:hypothetical protein
MNWSAQIRRAKRPIIYLCVLVFLGFIAIWFGDYARTLIWHFEHGDSAQLWQQHAVKLPMNWRMEESKEPGISSMILPARIGLHSVSAIVVRPVLPGEIADNDQQELALTKAAVESRNHDSFANSTSKVLVLRNKNYTLYCTEEMMLSESGKAAYANLACHSTRLGFSILYHGLANREGEAISIMSSLN